MTFTPTGKSERVFGKIEAMTGQARAERDILMKLRDWRKRMPAVWYGNVTLDAAADEIERLRAALISAPAANQASAEREERAIQFSIQCGAGGYHARMMAAFATNEILRASALNGAPAAQTPSGDILEKLDGAWDEDSKTNLMHYCDLAGQEIRKLRLERDQLRVAVEILRTKLIAIHQISQEHDIEAWERLQNITATASSALTSTESTSGGNNG